jgi:hypothetical protein
MVSGVLGITSVTSEGQEAEMPDFEMIDDAINKQLDRAKSGFDVELHERGKSSKETDLYEDTPGRVGRHLNRLRHDILHVIESFKMLMRLTRRIEDRVEAIEKTELSTEVHIVGVEERLDRLEEAFLQDDELSSQDVASLRALVYGYRKELRDGFRWRDRWYLGLSIGFFMLVVMELIRAWDLYEIARLHWN